MRGLTETYTIATNWKVMCGKDVIGYKLPVQGCLLFCTVFKACPHIYQLYRQDVGRFLEEYAPFCFIKLCERVGYWGTIKCDLFTLAVCPGALNSLKWTLMCKYINSWRPVLVPAVCLPFPLCLANQWQTSSVITAAQLHDTACQALDTHRNTPFSLLGCDLCDLCKQRV